MKRFFLGGLKALLPTILTLWVVIALVGFVGDYVAMPVTRAIHWALITNRLGQSVLESATPIRVYDRAYVKQAELAEEGLSVEKYLADMRGRDTFLLDLSKIDRERLYADLSERFPPMFGLAVGFVLIFVAGFLLRGYVGKLLFSRGERLFFSFPIVRRIYPYAKQIVDFFLKDKSTIREFQTVVAVPYPSPGMFTLGFVTSDGLRSLNDRKGEEFVAVFVPSSPTPMTGYVCFIKKQDIVPLSMTLDQTMGLIISGGVIVPEHELVDPRDRERLLRGPSVDGAPSLFGGWHRRRAAAAVPSPEPPEAP